MSNFLDQRKARRAFSVHEGLAVGIIQRCRDFLFYSIDQVHLIMVDPKKSIDSVSTMGRFFAS